jgi:hypothetical protein
VDVVMGIATLAIHPVDSVTGLAKLPGAVRALLENAPEYWEHYQVLPRGEQARQAARLMTNVVLVCGTAGVGSTRAASAGSQLGRLSVPVLSLSTEGALALRMVAIPAGQLVTAVGSGASAIYVLHMAENGAGDPPHPSDVKKRPSGFRKKTVQDAWDNAAEGASGGKKCPTCQTEVSTPPEKGTREQPRDWDVDHQPPWKQRELSGKTRQEVLDDYNEGTRLECPSCNRSRGATPAEKP